MLGLGCRIWSHTTVLDEGGLAQSSKDRLHSAKPKLPSSNPSSSSSIVAPLIPLFTLYLLSPALKTLTKATTSDSIWALSGTLFCINLCLGDYRAIPPTYRRRHRAPVPPETSDLSTSAATPTLATSSAPSTLPLTAALSGSTVLASRLDSNLSVFSLLLFATLWFGPWPLLRSDLPLRPTLGLTSVLVVVSLAALRSLGGAAAGFGALMLFGTSVVAPIVRGWLGARYKDRVRGPWDQAVPKV